MRYGLELPCGGDGVSVDAARPVPWAPDPRPCPSSSARGRGRCRVGDRGGGRCRTPPLPPDAPSAASAVFSAAATAIARCGPPVTLDERPAAARQPSLRRATGRAPGVGRVHEQEDVGAVELARARLRDEPLTGGADLVPGARPIRSARAHAVAKEWALDHSAAGEGHDRQQGEGWGEDAAHPATPSSMTTTLVALDVRQTPIVPVRGPECGGHDGAGPTPTGTR